MVQNNLKTGRNRPKKRLVSKSRNQLWEISLMPVQRVFLQNNISAACEWEDVT
jgi:hypothetical protein